ncbi:MAG: hypothetical protein J5802_09320 [Butyrivibrio sp.]|nr:hypothetical protein [Butyrivibrio sp.]
MRKYGIVLLGVVSIMLLFGCGAKEEPTIDFEKLGIDTTDGPTAVFMAEKKDEECIEYDNDQPADNSYSAVIDRVLNEYEYKPVPWNNTIEFKEDADILVDMAEDPTGRYRAYGIISKEKGANGIILNDTINGTDRNINCIFEEWFYTATSTDEPYFSWEENTLYFTYPVPTSGESDHEIKKVKIDCGYDTGHMEFVDE